MLASVFDPALGLSQAAIDRLAPILSAQLSLIWDEWAKRDQEWKSKLLAVQKRAKHKFDKREDILAPSLFSAADRAEVADHMGLLAAQRRAFGDQAGSRGRGGGGRGGNGRRSNGQRPRGGAGAPAPAPAPSPSPSPSPGGKGGKGGKGKGRRQGQHTDPADAQAAQANNESAAHAAAGSGGGGGPSSNE